jgi:hypothetical protein
VVTPAEVVGRLAGDHPALVREQILVGEAPLALDVNDADAGAAAARDRPRIAGVDPSRRRVEIDLPRREVRRCGRRVLGGRHVVQQLGRFRGRFHVRRVDRLVVEELLGNAREIPSRPLDSVEDGEIG